MQISSSGRFVFVAQWVLAVVLPIWLYFGRAVLGAELGWMAVLALGLAPMMIIALLIPPIVSLFDREVRKAKAARVAYSALTWIIWIALLLSSLVVIDASDGTAESSVLTNWTGMDWQTSETIFLVLMGVAAVAWLGALVTAIMGIVRGRRAL